MLSARRTWAVTRYELTWDLRKKRTYLILGLFLLAAFGFGYLLPVIAGKSGLASMPEFAGGLGNNLWWLNAVFLVFNIEISGLFPLLIGGFISTDSFASEFDKNTIVPLLSQPVRRIEVYAGKLLEKFLLMLAVSLLFTLLVLASSEVSVGAQAHLDWFPLVVLSALGAFLEYTVLTFFFGSFLRSASMVLGILIGVFFGVTIGFLLLALKYGLQEWMFLLPIANADSLLDVVPYYIFHPSGTMVLQATISSSQTQPHTVTVLSALEYALAGLAINLVVPIIAGYSLFKRAEVKG